jgi:hypothetical protein
LPNIRKKVLHASYTRTQVFSNLSPDGDGWVAEIAIPLTVVGGWDINVEDGLVVGFQNHYNDDDDGGDRDHKLIWSAKDKYDDLSWQSPARFGQLQFCQVGGTGTPTETPADAGDDGGAVTPSDGGDAADAN